MILLDEQPAHRTGGEIPMRDGSSHPPDNFPFDENLLIFILQGDSNNTVISIRINFNQKKTI